MDEQGDSYIPPQTLFAGGIITFLLQDKYNIGALTVNIDIMWLGMKRL
jgi:hypothetical protein